MRSEQEALQAREEESRCGAEIAKAQKGLERNLNADTAVIKLMEMCVNGLEAASRILCTPETAPGALLTEEYQKTRRAAESAIAAYFGYINKALRGEVGYWVKYLDTMEKMRAK